MSAAVRDNTVRMHSKNNGLLICVVFKTVHGDAAICANSEFEKFVFLRLRVQGYRERRFELTDAVVQWIGDIS